MLEPFLPLMLTAQTPPPASMVAEMGLAFLGGVISFISPCVLPLVPIYMSLISGVSVSDLRGGQLGRKTQIQVLLSAGLFVLGFTIVFVALGATATTIGEVLSRHLLLIQKIAGVAIVIMGLHVLGVFRVAFLNYEKKLEGRTFRSNWITAFVTGLAFSAGWTPCLGPILAGILSVAATQATVVRGMVLLAVYSMGLGIPFLLVAIGTGASLGTMNWVKRHFRAVELTSGSLLILAGLLLYFDQFTRLSGIIASWLPVLNRLG